MLTQRQKQAIYNYQQSSNYGIIGNYLRSGGFQQGRNNKYSNLVRKINSVINNSPRGTKNITVYRGFPSRFIEPGRDLINRSYLSTSTNKRKAKEFGNVVVKINVPRTLKRHIMNDAREGEILIERGTRLTNIKMIGPNSYTAKLMNNKSNIMLSPRSTLNNYKRLNLSSNNENSNFNN